MAEYKFSFEKLKREVTILQVVEQLTGTKLKQTKPDEFRGCCPISNGTNPRQFVVTTTINSYVCFCDDCKRFPKRGGDAIELIRRHRRLDNLLAAAKEIAQHFGIACDGGATPAPADQPQDTNGGFDLGAFQRRLQPEHEALSECGVSSDTIKTWRGGYSAGAGSLAGRLALPICNADGSIEGFLGVALKGETPEIKYPKRVNPPQLFGSHLVQAGADLHVVQHPLDVLRYTEDGLNVVGVLQPITPDILTALAALMAAKDIQTVEFH